MQEYSKWRNIGKKFVIVEKKQEKKNFTASEAVSDKQNVLFHSCYKKNNTKILLLKKNQQIKIKWVVKV